jgi:hypothetical protein
MNVTLDFRTNEMRRDTGTSIRTGEFESKKWSVGGILSTDGILGRGKVTDPNVNAKTVFGIDREAYFGLAK